MPRSHYMVIFVWPMHLHCLGLGLVFVREMGNKASKTIPAKKAIRPLKDIPVPNSSLLQSVMSQYPISVPPHVKLTTTGSSEKNKDLKKVIGIQDFIQSLDRNSVYSPPKVLDKSDKLSVGVWP